MRSTFLQLVWRLTWAALVVSFRRLRVDRGQRWRTAVLVEILKRDLELIRQVEPAEMRRHERPAPIVSRLARRVAIQSRPLAGIEGLWLVPRGEEPPEDVVLYLHGGGFCLCSPRTHRALAARLVKATGAAFFLPDYRLAPEHPHPAAITDALTCYRALLAGGTDPRRLILAGDSAGGNLVLELMLRLRAEGEPLPRAAVLLSPWVDLALTHETVDRHAPTDYLSRPTLEVFVRHYLGEGDPRSGEVSPLYAELEGLPPLLIQLGAYECLAGEGMALVERAREAGVEVEVQVFEGQPHVFQAFAPLVPEARKAIREVGRFVRRLSPADPR